MALSLKIHLLSLNTLSGQSLKFQSNPNRPRTQILCSRSSSSISISDSELASDLAKINTHLLHKEEAMKKSKYLLFTELCQFLDLKEDQVKKKWSKFDEDEKWDLVKGFVSVWSVHFHPLSPRSVKQMIEEYLREQNQHPSSSPTSAPASLLFSGFKSLFS
ncbi:hypothetical protein ACOSP7_004839 [Xanthoceras sorbifolium]